MKDGCKGDGTCGRKERGECGCGDAHVHDLDIAALGPEAVELARLFDEVNSHLVSALKTRRQILEILHKRNAESGQMKKKMDKVLSTRHPVLMQFVFGQ